MSVQDIIETRQYLTFKLDEEVFAIDVAKVREVLDLTTITKVPRTPDFMSGVINLRGSVVPVVDFRLCFEMSKTDTTVNTCIVVVEVLLDGEATIIGALADSVEEVIDLEPDQIQPAPRIGTHVRTDFIRGMGKRDAQFVMILDIDKVFSADELGALQPEAGSRRLSRSRSFDLGLPATGRAEPSPPFLTTHGNVEPHTADAISTRDFARLQELIYSECGIRLSNEKRTMLEGRLRKRWRTLNLESCADYCKYLFNNPEAAGELPSLIDVVTTNKTDFFRESRHFEFLTQDRASPSLDPQYRELVFWSAGCSSGEEPYTLAMVLAEYARKTSRVSLPAPGHRHLDRHAGSRAPRDLLRRLGGAGARRAAPQVSAAQQTAGGRAGANRARAAPARGIPPIESHAARLWHRRSAGCHLLPQCADLLRSRLTQRRAEPLLPSVAAGRLSVPGTLGIAQRLRLPVPLGWPHSL